MFPPAETIDPWGNRTDQNVTAGTCGTFHAIVGTNNRFGSPYQYDAAGNMTYDGIHSYTYDAENHLTQVDAGTTASYIYDPSGNRVRKNSGASWTEYFYDMSGSVTAEHNSAGWPVEYVYVGGQLVAQYRDGTTYSIFKDHLDSTRLISKLDKTVFDSLDFMPFGEQIAGDTGTTHKFTGKERDSESGLDNFVVRFDSSAAGRFMSADPGNAGATPDTPQSWNAYSYVLNNPLNAIDPDGQDCVYLNSTHTSATVQSGDCTNPGGKDDDGIFVDGTVDVKAGGTLTQTNSGDSLAFSYTPDGEESESLHTQPVGYPDTLNPTATAVFGDLFSRLRWMDPEVCGGGGFIFVGGQVKIPKTNVHGELLGVLNYDSKNGVSAGGILEGKLFGNVHGGGEVAYSFKSHKVSAKEGLGFLGHETTSAKFGAYGGGLLASSQGDLGAYGSVGPVGGGAYAHFIPDGTPCKH